MVSANFDIDSLKVLTTDSFLPTEVGPSARPKKTPRDLPAQFRVVTPHNVEAPPKGRRSRMAQPEYDLNEIAKAIDTDGLLSRAISAHVTCILKDGWDLIGRNSTTKAYVQSRLDEISFMSQQPFQQIVQEAAENLVTYHNFFLYMVRANHRYQSSGRDIVYHGKRKRPIAALHHVDPTSIYPFIGDTVDIRSWHQFIDGRHFPGRAILFEHQTKGAKKYMPEDIIHGYMRRRTGFIFGTPFVVPVLDDIRALRRLEEIAELIAHRHAFPLIHLQVGTERIPVQELPNGETEVDVIDRQYRQVPLEGALVTSERVKLIPIPLDPMELDNLLEHYKNRAIMGLGVSDVDVGMGGETNRGSAVVMSKSLMDRCREYQKQLMMFFTWYLFDVLLMEGGFELTPENRVFMVFPEVDIDRRMALDNHARELYASHLMTETEARTSMGRDPITDEQRSDMFFERVQKPLAIIQAVDEPFTKDAKAVANKNRPENQNGQKTSKGTPKNTRIRGADMHALTDNLRTALFGYITKRFNDGEALEPQAMRALFTDEAEKIQDRLLVGAIPKIQTGFEHYVTDSQTPTVFHVGDPLRRQFQRRCIEPALQRFVGGEDSDSERLISDLCQRTEDHMVRVAAFFRSWETSWDVMLDRLDRVATRFGYMQAAWIDDSHQVVWNVSEPCARCADMVSKPVTPRTVNYHGLGDRDCDLTFRLVDRQRLPARVPLLVKSFAAQGDDGATLELSVPSREDYLDMDQPNRFLKIILDSQDAAVLPEEVAGGWQYSGSGKVQLPKFESGVAELWSDDRVVGRVRFEAMKEGV